MRRFKNINFYRHWPKIKLFLRKNTTTIFTKNTGLPPPDPQNSPSVKISGYVPKSNHLFALLVYKLPEVSLMPHFKNINFN